MRRRGRGFTLIELMVVLGVSSILGGTMLGIMYSQNLAYVQRLEELDAQANARAALGAIRHAVQAARYGLGQGTRVVGVAGLGRCFANGAPATSQAACDNVDNGADRLRVVALVNDPNFAGDVLTPGGDPCTGASVGTIDTSAQPPQPLLPGALVGIGGACVAGPPGTPAAASDVMIVTGDRGAAGGCAHRYAFTRIEDGATQLSCPTGYQRPFAFGTAMVTDFYVGAPGGGPQGLYMNRDAGRTQAQVVAFDVEDLQVEYGIDTNQVPDHGVDAWCSDPSPSGCTLADSGGTVLDAPSILSRIVVVRVYVRVRTSTPHPDITPDAPISDPNYLRLAAANPVVNNNDGYRRWVFGTTVALRNNNP